MSAANRNGPDDRNKPPNIPRRGAFYSFLMLIAVGLLAAVELHRQNELVLRVSEKTQYMATRLMDAMERQIPFREGHARPRAVVDAFPKIGRGRAATQLSLQELQDDVDALITHVEKEAEMELVEVQKIHEKWRIRRQMQHGDTVNDDIMKIPELSFDEAVKLLSNLRPNLRAESLLEVDALQLQAQRGDYDATRHDSLFKSGDYDDAEVEQDGELWNSWRTLKGMYKSDAMRRLIARVEEFEDMLQKTDAEHARQFATAADTNS